MATGAVVASEWMLAFGSATDDQLMHMCRSAAFSPLYPVKVHPTDDQLLQMCRPPGFSPPYPVKVHPTDDQLLQMCRPPGFSPPYPVKVHPTDDQLMQMCRPLAFSPPYPVKGHSTDDQLMQMCRPPAFSPPNSVKVHPTDDQLMQTCRPPAFSPPYPVKGHSTDDQLMQMCRPPAFSPPYSVKVHPTDDQLMQTGRPPAFSPPYPVKVHPKFSSSLFKEKVAEWLQHFKVDTIFSPKMYQMLLTMDIPAFGARIYSKAPEWGLEWGCKFLVMLWLWDDTMDSTDTGKDPEKALALQLDVNLLMMWSFPDDPVLRTQLEPLLNMLDGQAREEKVRYIKSVLAEARIQPGTVYSNCKPTSRVLWDIYLELWKDVTARASPEFCLRLAHSNQLWLMGCLKEAATRKLRGGYSSVEEYIQVRRGCSAVIPTIVIVDFMYGLNTPDTWFQNREMKNVLDAVNDIISWHNDVWSFKREVLIEKDISNMVLAISIHRKVSYTEAADITTQMIYDRILDLERAIKGVESVTPPEYRQNFEVYMMTCRHYISGTHDWHSKSVRYQ